VEVASTLGEGSTFTLVLPRTPEAEESVEVPVEPPGTSRRTGT
jgi:hypothetical protein